MARNIAPQDISWFLDLNERERLDLTPPYQRKSVWSSKERKYLLDTIFNGYPCPPLFLYKSISDKGVSTFHVVDGKQRLETVISFANNKISIPQDFENTELAGKKFRQLTIEQKKTFWNYQFAVELLDVVDAATVKEIFNRYNRTAKNLNPQELRHAKYDGWFISFAENEATKPEWQKYGVSTTARARRMQDVQYISELMIAVLERGKIIGFDQDTIEDFYAKYEVPSESDTAFSEEDFSQRFESIKDIITQLENQNASISKYVKQSINSHLYSLWSILSDDSIQLPTIDVLANQYEEFMERVFELSKHENAQELLKGDQGLLYELPFKYYENAIGAATEEPQRKARNEALRQYLLH